MLPLDSQRTSEWNRSTL
nr:unnamed protein product [Callosobruchus analis]